MKPRCRRDAAESALCAKQSVSRAVALVSQMGEVGYRWLLTKSTGVELARHAATNCSTSSSAIVAGPPTLSRGETDLRPRALALYSRMYGSGNGTPHNSFQTSKCHSLTASRPYRPTKCSATEATRPSHSANESGGMARPL